MTTNSRGFDLGAFIAVVALGVFLTVLFFFIGGLVFSLVWGIFVVPVFGLPTISIAEGAAAIILLWLTGWALRGGTSRTKKDD